jgi:hypothetical protein
MLCTFQGLNLIDILSLRSFIQRIWPSPRLCQLFVTIFFFYGELLFATCPTPKLEDHFVVCPWLLIRYIHSYPPLLEAILPPETQGYTMLW